VFHGFAIPTIAEHAKWWSNQLHWIGKSFTFVQNPQGSLSIYIRGACACLRVCGRYSPPFRCRICKTSKRPTDFIPNRINGLSLVRKLQTQTHRDEQ
jgi:hypothetical protein